MNLIIHRGTHQIGGSCIEVFSDATRLAIDIGAELPQLDGSLKAPFQLPKIKGLFEGEPKKIDALLVSHSHGDHMGLIDKVNPQIPVYIGEKALAIYNTTSRFTGGKQVNNNASFLESGQEFTVGDFMITPYLVDHSGFDAYAFVIKHDHKHLVYTGDFRKHGRKKQATNFFIANLPSRIDALIIEGTMMSRMNEAVETEDEIEKKAFEFMQSKDKPVFVLQSAANIDRLVSMFKAALQSRRIFVMDIFTAHIVSQLNGRIPKPGFQNIRVFYPRFLNKRFFNEPGGAALMKQFSRFIIKKDELARRKDYCMLIRESMLYDLKGIGDLKGAGLIYSKWSGYKKQVAAKALLDYAKIKEMDIIDLHTSGHACQKTLREIIKRSKARKIVPIHTEKPELFKEFENVYLSQDGEVIVI